VTPPIARRVVGRGAIRAQDEIMEKPTVDTRDGRIYDAEAVAMMAAVDREYMVPMAHHPTPAQRAVRRVGRNDLCPCGSGKKFKKCHLFRVSQGA
jgi:preprotein translocase subunit SecA